MRTHEKELLLSLLETTLSNYCKAKELHRNHMSGGKSVALKTEDKLNIEPACKAPDIIDEGSALTCDDAPDDAVKLHPHINTLLSIGKCLRLMDE